MYRYILVDVSVEAFKGYERRNYEKTRRGGENRDRLDAEHTAVQTIQVISVQATNMVQAKCFEFV